MGLWIELPRPENPANTCAWHTETLDSCFDFIRSHQQSKPWSAPLEIQPATTEYRAETLLLSHSPHRTQVMPNQLVMVIAQPINLSVSCKLHPNSLQRTRSPPVPRLPRKIGNTHLRIYHNLKGKDINVNFPFFFWLRNYIVRIFWSR